MNENILEAKNINKEFNDPVKVKVLTDIKESLESVKKIFLE